MLQSELAAVRRWAKPLAAQWWVKLLPSVEAPRWAMAAKPERVSLHEAVRSLALGFVPNTATRQRRRPRRQWRQSPQ